MQVVGLTVGEFPFGERPNTLVGIQLRGVGWEILDAQTRMPPLEFVQQTSLVGLGIVQQDDDRSSEMAQEMPKESADSPSADIVQAELIVEPQSLTPRADGNRRDDRDAIVTIAMAVDWGMTPWCPGAKQIRNQEEPRFVEEDEVGAQPCSVFFTRGQRFCFQCLIALSSRSTARRSGVCELQPSPCSSRPTWSR